MQDDHLDTLKKEIISYLVFKRECLEIDGISELNISVRMLLDIIEFVENYVPKGEIVFY